MKKARIDHVGYDEIGFSMNLAGGGRFHQHGTIEIGMMENGTSAITFGSGRHIIRPGRLTLFWGAIPHGRSDVVSGNPRGVVLHVPLPWFLSWNLPSSFVANVLDGAFIMAAKRRLPCPDPALMRHWLQLFDKNTPLAREAVLHSVRARVTELAMEQTGDSRSAAPAAMGGGGGRQVLIVHRILQTIAKNHSKPVSVHDIAEACGVTREHAMRIFARATGTTIHDYLVRYRIATAQRLLATSDAKIGAIARDSGFSSEAPFYTAFRRIVGKSPWKYRTAISDRHSQAVDDKHAASLR